MPPTPRKKRVVPPAAVVRVSTPPPPSRASTSASSPLRRSPRRAPPAQVEEVPSTPPPAPPPKQKKQRNTINWGRLAKTFLEYQNEPPPTSPTASPPPPVPTSIQQQLTLTRAQISPMPSPRSTSTDSPLRKRSRLMEMEQPPARSPSHSPTTPRIPIRRFQSQQSRLEEDSGPLAGPVLLPLSRPSHGPEDKEDEVPPDIPEECDPNEIDYSVWKTSNWYVAADERPKVKKVRGTDYHYEKLASLDGQLKTLALKQFRQGQKPTLMLRDQRFVYGLVTSIVPRSFCQENEFRVLICDETRTGRDQDVLVRICTWPTESKKGPAIRIGDVIRIHRVTVQHEHNTARDSEEMVLSTAPHWNYVIFRLTQNSVEYDTLAKTITFHEDKDIPIIQSLLDLAKQRAGDGRNRSQHNLSNLHLSQSWDGNTSPQTLAQGNDQLVLSPGPVPLPPQNPAVSQTSVVDEASAPDLNRSPQNQTSFQSPTGTRMTRGRGRRSGNRRENATSRFHALPPPYPT